MRLSSKRNFKVGVTVVASVFILLYGITFLKQIKFGLETNALSVYFQDVNGLKESDPVSVNGVLKGRITKIELSGSDSVRVDFNLAKDVELKKDYIITVAMIELMSGKQIYIKPGKEKELADITKPLSGARNTDIVSLITTMNDVSYNVSKLTARLDTTVKDLNSVIRNVNSIAGDEGLKSNIRSTAGNFNLASRNLNLMLAESRTSLNSLVSRLNNVAANLNTTVDETKPEVKQTFRDIRDLTSRIDSLTMNLNSFVLNTKDSSNSVGKLLTNDEFYNNLNKTILSMNKLIRKIEKDGLRLKLF